MGKVYKIYDKHLCSQIVGNIIEELRENVLFKKHVALAQVTVHFSDACF